MRQRALARLFMALMITASGACGDDDDTPMEDGGTDGGIDGGDTDGGDTDSGMMTEEDAGMDGGDDGGDDAGDGGDDAGDGGDDGGDDAGDGGDDGGGLPNGPLSSVTMVTGDGFHSPTDAVVSLDGSTFYDVYLVHQPVRHSPRIDIKYLVLVAASSIRSCMQLLLIGYIRFWLNTK